MKGKVEKQILTSPTLGLDPELFEAMKPELLRRARQAFGESTPAQFYKLDSADADRVARICLKFLDSESWSELLDSV